MGSNSPRSKNNGRAQRALARSEWDFVHVPKSKVSLVCMREYAKECLHKDALQRHSIFIEAFTEAFNRPPPLKVTADMLFTATWNGLKQRAAIADLELASGLPLEEITKDSPPPSPAHPVDVVAFAIDWRAGNSEIKRAFGRWVEKKQQSHVRSMTWHTALFRAMSESSRRDARSISYDYLNMYEALKESISGFKDVRDGGAVKANIIIKSFRSLSGMRMGRGDSKAARLTDLSVYRLHRSGCSPEKIATLLGKDRQKFCHSTLIARTIKRTEGYIARMFVSALVCEFFLLLNAESDN